MVGTVELGEQVSGMNSEVGQWVRPCISTFLGRKEYGTCMPLKMKTNKGFPKMSIGEKGVGVVKLEENVS